MKDLAKIGGLLLVGCALAFAFTKALPSSLDFEIAATRDTIRLTDSVYVTQTDTVVQWQRRVDTVRAQSDSLDALVSVVGDSSVSLRSFPSDTMPTVVHIPPVVVANLAALRLTVASQDTLIRALYQRDTTQQWRIATARKLYTLDLQKANGPRWGVGGTLGYGCGEHGCGPQVTVGVTYQAKVPSPKALLRSLVK